MLLKVDNREKIIIPALTTACNRIEGVKIETENMPLGDAGIYADNGDELVLFERKSLSDLAASIKDGRYSEQSLRLSATLTPNHNIVYIIEGSLDQYNYKRNKIHPNTLLSAMVSLNYFKGFSVVRTWNVLETIELIMSYVEKLNKNANTKDKSKIRTPYYSATQIRHSLSSNTLNELETNKSESIVLNAVSEMDNKMDEYLNTIKRVKKDNVTVDNIAKLMLCQIPGVSMTSADAITAEYPTMEKLIEACKKGRAAFENIRLKTSNRKLASNCISSVITFMLSKPSASTETVLNVSV